MPWEKQFNRKVEINQQLKPPQIELHSSLSSPDSRLEILRDQGQGLSAAVKAADSLTRQ